jgi:hypothetical protein
MTILTDADFTFYKHEIRRRPTAKAEMKAQALSKATWKAVMQALEDEYETFRPTAKAAIDAAAGVTLSNALAKQLEDIWMERRSG